ncbi:hypothetical protein BJ965_001059 [Streptomyces luteogriseus]|uniref:Uncharacterized protein n=1 Tax=Streptomyces luteogriseus TaxID=68233 RepID=A0A7W7DKW9_9ACTN|nr:DUF6257 family protein [Streptomyces luteogriseus]MBB4711177.1 hypothetical protein [Streptomyces luteogriseus]
MADDLSLSDYTPGELAKLSLLTARMAKRGLAGMDVDLSDLKRKAERIEQQALRRKQKP